MTDPGSRVMNRGERRAVRERASLSRGPRYLHGMVTLTCPECRETFPIYFDRVVADSLTLNCPNGHKVSF
jgi:hypothetical protein